MTAVVVDQDTKRDAGRVQQTTILPVREKAADKPPKNSRDLIWRELNALARTKVEGLPWFIR